MDFKNISDIAKIIALCRKKGVNSCKITENSIELNLGSPVQSIKRGSKIVETHNPLFDGLTPDQILNWSVNNVGEESAAG